MMVIVFLIGLIFLTFMAVGWVLGSLYGAYVLVQTFRGKDVFFPFNCEDDDV